MTEQSQKPKAYSYTRFSTPEQAKGDSHRRQADAAKDWCDRNKVQLDQDLTFLDAGVSAFRGRNVEIGKLGEFRAAVDAGLVPQGSFLLVESLDRISRQAAHRAVRTLMDIIDLGVTVVTLTDGKSYDLETLEKDQMSFLMAILIFMRSAEESQMKSSRLKSTWSQRRATTKGGKVLTRGTKSWIKVNDKGELKVRPEIAKSICYIFETYLTGKGVTHIATRLNERGAPTGTRARAWDAARVYRVLSDRAVLGTLSLNTTEHVGGRKIMHPAEQVEGYYPPVIDKETFDRAQIIKAQAKQTRTSGRKMVNIFSGVMKCSRCGAGVVRSTKGKGPALMCRHAKVGACKPYGTVQCHIVERSFYGDVDQIVERAPTASHDGRLDDHLMVLSDQADELQERISNLLDVVQRGDHAAMGRVRVLEGELKGITDQIEGIASDREALSNALIQARAKMLQEAVEDQDVPKINAALRLLMERIVIDMELATLTYHYRGGGEFTMLYKMA